MSAVFCSCHCPDSLAQYQRDNFACVKADYVHFFMAGFGVSLMCVCMEKVIQYGVRMLSCLPIVFAPHTLVHWNNANSYPYCTHSKKENERVLWHRRTHARSPVCQTQGKHNDFITWRIFAHITNTLNVDFFQLLLCFTDLRLSVLLHLNLEVYN